MSTRRTIEPKPAAPAADPVAHVEAVARFKHDGVDRRPGDVMAMTTTDAADLVAVGFARPHAGYGRRDMRSKG